MRCRAVGRVLHALIKSSLGRRRTEDIPRDAVDRLRAFGQRLVLGIEPEAP